MSKQASYEGVWDIGRNISLVLPIMPASINTIPNPSSNTATELLDFPHPFTESP